MASTDFDPTPDALLEQGQLQLGVFQAPIKDVNLDQACLPKTSQRASRRRLKQWQHWLIVGPELALTLAIVDVGYLKLGWIQAVVRASGERYEWTGKGPWARCSLARSLWDDRSQFVQRSHELRFHSQLSASQHRLEFRGNASASLPQIRGELRARHDLETTRPLVVCLPVGDGRAMYSHKVPLPVEGTVELDGHQYTFSTENSSAFSDIHKAHYPRHTWWDWACFAFHQPNGRLVGLNLTHNLAHEPDRYNENALWLDGKPIRLGRPHFTRNRGDLMQPWEVQTACGRASLQFRPLGGRSEDLQLGVISSQFQQLYGHWSGTLRFGDETISVDQVFGLGEDHECRW